MPTAQTQDPWSVVSQTPIPSAPQTTSSQPAATSAPSTQSDDPWAVVSHQPAAPATPPETGVLASVKRNTVGVVQGMFHAFTDPATEQEKSEILQKIRDENAKGENISEDLANNPSRGTLALHRLIDAPADQLAKKGGDELAVAKDLLGHHEYWKGGNLYLSGLADKALSAVPLAGPAIGGIASRGEGALIPAYDKQGNRIATSDVPADRKDFSGAATDTAALIAGENAKEIVGGVKKLTTPSAETLAAKGLDNVGKALKVSTSDEAMDAVQGIKGDKTTDLMKATHAAKDDLAKIQERVPVSGKDSNAAFTRLKSIVDYRNELWENEHEGPVSRHADVSIDEQAPVKLALEEFTKAAGRANKAEYESAFSWLEEQNKPTTIKEADDLVREINADVNTPKGQAAYGALQMRVKSAYLKGLRAEIDTTLEDHGETGIKDANRRYGALGTVQNEYLKIAEGLAKSEAKDAPAWTNAIRPVVAIKTGGASELFGAVIKPERLTKLFSKDPVSTFERGIRQLSDARAQTAATPAETPGTQTPATPSAAFNAGKGIATAIRDPFLPGNETGALDVSVRGRVPENLTQSGDEILSKGIPGDVSSYVKRAVQDEVNHGELTLPNKGQAINEISDDLTVKALHPEDSNGTPQTIKTAAQLSDEIKQQVLVRYKASPSGIAKATKPVPDPMQDPSIAGPNNMQNQSRSGVRKTEFESSKDAEQRDAEKMAQDARDRVVQNTLRTMKKNDPELAQTLEVTRKLAQEGTEAQRAGEELPDGFKGPKSEKGVPGMPLIRRVAEELGIDEKTVRAHYTKIQQKYGPVVRESLGKQEQPVSGGATIGDRIKWRNQK